MKKSFNKSHCKLFDQIDFEEVYFSEVNKGASRLVVYNSSYSFLDVAQRSLEDVMEIVQKNKVCLRGVLGIPEVSLHTDSVSDSDVQYGQGGELMGLNTAFRKQLDLYANVVKVNSEPFLICNVLTEGEESSWSEESAQEH